MWSEAEGFPEKTHRKTRSHERIRNHVRRQIVVGILEEIGGRWYFPRRRFHFPKSRTGNTVFREVIHFSGSENSFTLASLRNRPI